MKPTPFFTSSALPLIAADTVTSRTPQCHKCRLYQTCKSPKMPVSGNGKKGILVLAEAPGKDEDARGVQLVGESGRKLEAALRRHGVDMREDCWLENSLRCRPPKNRTPTDAEIDYCRPNVLNTIRELNPRVIIVLGGVAVKSLIGHLWKESPGGVNRWVGYAIPDRQLDAWVCPTYHPAFLLWEKNDVAEILFDRHLRAAAKLKGRPYPKPPPDPDRLVDVVWDETDAVQLIIAAQDLGTVAFDFETTTLKPDGEHARIVCCSLSDGHRVVVFPWYPKVRKAMKSLLAGPHVKKVGSNIAFETRWARKHLGVITRGWVWDTMLAAHALDNGGKGRAVTGIKFQAYARLGLPAWEGRVAPYLKSAGGGNTPNRVREVDPDTLMRYCAKDSLYEMWVARHQADEMGVEL